MGYQRRVHGTDVSQISSHHYITAVFPSSKSIYSPSYAQQNALLTLSHPPFPDNIPHNCKHRSGRKQTNRLLAVSAPNSIHFIHQGYSTQFAYSSTDKAMET